MEKINKLSEAERFCLDAYITNNNKELAYRLSRRQELKGSPESIYQQQQRWLRSAPVAEYIDLRKRELESRYAAGIEAGEMPVEVGKDELLQELTRLFRMEKDPKLKSEIAMKLADLKQLKKAEEKPEQQQVKYYLPLPEKEIPGYILARMEQDSQFAEKIKKICQI